MPIYLPTLSIDSISPVAKKVPPKHNGTMWGKILADMVFQAVIWAGDKFQLANDSIVKQLEVLKRILAQESVETRKMLEIYARQAQGKATPTEMQFARAQFIDIIKAAGIGFYALLPFTLLTIPFFVRLGRRFGVEILPSSFQGIITPQPPKTKKATKKKPKKK